MAAATDDLDLDLELDGKKNRRKPKKERRSFPTEPMRVLVDWLQADSPKDARAYVRGVVQKQFQAHEESWYSVVPFQGGFLWECHEGGDGKGYSKSIIKALTENPGGEYWFPAGDRAYEIKMQDALPAAFLLPDGRSVEFYNNREDNPPLERNASMTRFLSKGTGWLATGIAMSSVAAVFFIGSIAFYAVAYNPGPSVRAVEVATMPHMQWPKVAGTSIEEVVGSLSLKGNDWKVVKRTHHIPNLDNLRNLRSKIERFNRDADTAQDALKKAADEAADKADQEALMKTIEDIKTANGMGSAAVEPTQVPPQQAPAAVDPVSQPTPPRSIAPVLSGQAPAVVQPQPAAGTMPVTPPGAQAVKPKGDMK
jgi:hypothetical protein